MFAGNDVIAISSLGGASGNFWLRILKGRPRLYIFMFNWRFSSYLERFRRYSTFFIWLGFPYWGRNCGGLGQNDPKTSNKRKHLLGGHFLTLNRVFWAIVREIISIRLACAGVQEKKGIRAGRQEEKSQEVYFSRMRGATPSRRIPTKLGTCVHLTDVIKRAKFYRYILRGFGAVRCWSFHVAIRNQGRP